MQLKNATLTLFYGAIYSFLFVSSFLRSLVSFLVGIFCLIWGGGSSAHFFDCNYSDVQIYLTFTFFSRIFVQFFFRKIPDKIYWNTTEIYKFCYFNTRPPISMLRSDKFWKKSLSKPTLSSGGGRRECGRRKLWNLWLFHLFCPRL